MRLTIELCMDHLVAGHTGTAEEIAAAIYRSYNRVRQAMADLLRTGRVRVAGYRRSPKGVPARIYAVANGKANAMPPAPLGSAHSCRKYRRQLRARLGGELGAQVLRAMDQRASMLVVDGRVIYRRGEGVLVDRMDEEAA